MSRYEGWSKEALISRVLELEGKFVSNVPNSRPPPSLASRSKRSKQMDFSRYSMRHVAIKFAYLGWNYYGLAMQKDPNTPTIEAKILNALYRTKCIPSLDPVDCNFSRCGRTDRDVSAMTQVISLNLRSNLSKEEMRDPENDSRELDYLKILNSQLPEDILAYEICLRPPSDFNARFSCRYRHYRYYFHRQSLDVSAMNDAANMLLGDHDFRNFCRIDASKQISNFRRTILHAEIVDGGDLCYLSLRGTAFLWNQVRSIMAILFIVGQKLESPEIVRILLSVDQTPRRPVYEIAWGVPLVLYDCGFDPMEWKASSATSLDQAFNVWHQHWQKMSMVQTMLDVIGPRANHISKNRINVGDGIGARTRYIPLMQRPVLDLPEEINARWIAKKEECYNK